MTDPTTRPDFRAPRDEFEAGLFLSAIRADLDAWTTGAVSVLSGSASDEPPDVPGVWRIVVEPRDRPFTPGSILNGPAVWGRVWLEDLGYGRRSVVWEVGSQCNGNGEQPILFWDDPNPAGPFGRAEAVGA